MVQAASRIQNKHKKNKGIVRIRLCLLNLDIYRYNTGNVYIIPINSQFFIIPLIIITDKLMQIAN